MDKGFDFEGRWTEIVSIIPITDGYGGNSTAIYMETGEKIILTKKTNTVLKNLSKVFALDLGELKKKYGKLIGRKSSTPLAFHPNLILLPVKVRQPLVKDEGARGYVANGQILKIEARGKNQSRIVFKNDNYLDCLQSLTSLNLLMAHSRIIAREFYSSFGNLKEREEIYRAVSVLLSTLKERQL